MPTRRYVALLRGINVGGRNKVPMAHLREMFEGHGFGDVATYIQSGNVLFASDGKRDVLEGEIERMLQKILQLEIMVVVRSHIQIRNVVDRAPESFGTDPGTYYYNTAFLKEPLSPARTMRAIELREGVDRAWPGPGVLYLQTLYARSSQSRISRIVTTPEYALMTMRNWNTTTRLMEMLDTAAAGSG